MKQTLRRLHGVFRVPIADGFAEVGTDVVAMVPSNHVYHNPAKLRNLLDKQGYLLLKNVVPRNTVARAQIDVARQLEENNWTRAEDMDEEFKEIGVVTGVPYPRNLLQDGRPIQGKAPGEGLPPMKSPIGVTQSIQTAACGPSVMAALRQVFGGAVKLLNHHTLELAPPGETNGFYMPSTLMNRGTKLVVNAWVPLCGMPFSVGGMVTVLGSNTCEAFTQVRKTYGQLEVESGNVRGDGCFTRDVAEILAYGQPLATTAFEQGDVVLTTCYSMVGYSTNTSTQWRTAVSTKWIMEGDDVGPDPRYDGPQPVGLSGWLASRDDPKRYPKTMAEAKKEWGVDKPPKITPKE